MAAAAGKPQECHADLEPRRLRIAVARDRDVLPDLLLDGLLMDDEHGHQDEHEPQDAQDAGENAIPADRQQHGRDHDERDGHPVGDHHVRQARPVDDPVVKLGTSHDLRNLSGLRSEPLETVISHIDICQQDRRRLPRFTAPRIPAVGIATRRHLVCGEKVKLS